MTLNKIDNGELVSCNHPDPELCKRLGKHIHSRLWEIWQGTADGISADEAAAYRDRWISEAPGNIVGQVVKCHWLGDPVLDGGTPKLKSCPTCNGKVSLKIFHCTCPSREPDQVTYQDCATCSYRPRDNSSAKALILRNPLSPGDILAMTAAIYSLHRQHPNKYTTAVDTPCPAIFEHNPDVISTEQATQLGAEPVQMHYNLVNSSNQRAVHFLQGYCDHLEQALGVRVPLLTNRPHVYLSTRERSWMSQVEEVTKKSTKFWLVCAGRKSDYTTKFWGTERYQDTVNRLRGKALFVQVGQSEHYHPPLKNVINLVGKTDLRQLIRLAWHAQGGVGGVTFLQHLMAAHEKPYVCIMGGREGVNWNSYQRQQLLHTVGALPCCKSGGCWKSRVEELSDGNEKNKSLCENPVIGDEIVGKCMTMIRPEEVAEKILQYQH